jgi:hypothetical protein
MKVNWNTTLNAITACATVFIAVTGIWALRFAERQIEESQHEAKIQFIEAKGHEYDSDRFIGIRHRLAKERMGAKEGELVKYSPSGPPTELMDEVDFCDDLGMLVNDDALDIDDVWSAFSSWLFVLEKDARAAIAASQKTDGPAYHGDCMALIQGMVPIEKEENQGRDIDPSDEDIYRFYAGELDVQPGQVVEKSKTKPSR